MSGSQNQTNTAQFQQIRCFPALVAKSFITPNQIADTHLVNSCNVMSQQNSEHVRQSLNYTMFNDIIQ